MTTSYIALGSNLDKPGLQLQRAVDDIDGSPSVSVTGCSKLYLSAPLGPQDQPDFCNAVVEVFTSLKPLDLLDALQSIEHSHGRVRTLRWGPRTLDLDIVLYGDQVIQSERLTIPHYQMHLRNFVLFPLSDICPNLTLPDGSHLPDLLREVGQEGLQMLESQYPWY